MFATSRIARCRLGAPDEDRPRLRLPEDRAAADLPVAGIAARVPAAPGPFAAQHAAQLRATPSQLGGERPVAETVGQLAEVRVDEGELRRHEHRFRHLEELRAEVGPVAVRAGEIAAVRAAQALLVLVRALHVLPHARRRARVEERDLLAKERGVARPEAVLRRRQQQPDVEISRRPELDRRAQRPRAVRQLAALLWLPRHRVAQDLARELGIRVHHRQRVVRPAPEAEVQPGQVLVVAALGDRVLAAELLVHGGRAQQVRVPRQLARHPRAAPPEVGPGKPVAPGALAGGERRRLRAILRHQRSDVLPVRHPVGVAQRHRLPGRERERPSGARTARATRLRARRPARASRAAHRPRPPPGWRATPHRRTSRPTSRTRRRCRRGRRRRC